MAGMGSRFATIGIFKPKHEIIARDRTLFEWSMLSLSAFFSNRFIFVVRSGFYNRRFIEDKCRNLGVNNIEILELSEVTSGQAASAFLADPLILPSSPIAIFNIDTYIASFNINLSSMVLHDGFLPVFTAEGSKWSFIKVDSNNRIVDVVEKVRVSNLATIGFYYFKTWEIFSHYYLNYSELIIMASNESYIAPLYKYMLADGLDIGYSILPTESVHGLGTPEDITSFDPDFLVKNTC